jgi:hypothetical protein
MPINSCDFCGKDYDLVVLEQREEIWRYKRFKVKICAHCLKLALTKVETEPDIIST